MRPKKKIIGLVTGISIIILFKTNLFIWSHLTEKSIIKMINMLNNLLGLYDWYNICIKNMCLAFFSGPTSSQHPNIFFNIKQVNKSGAKHILHAIFHE